MPALVAAHSIVLYSIKASMSSDIQISESNSKPAGIQNNKFFKLCFVIFGMSQRTELEPKLQVDLLSNNVMSKGNIKFRMFAQ